MYRLYIASIAIFVKNIAPSDVVNIIIIYYIYMLLYVNRFVFKVLYIISTLCKFDVLKYLFK